MTMERMMSVEVVVRDQVGPIASGLVPELIESFLDCPSVDYPEGSVPRIPLAVEAVGGTKRRDHRPRLRLIKISTRVMDAAALRGHLEVIKWLHENRSEGCSVHAMDSAAAGGHLDVVQWLHENRTEGCTTGAMDTAAAGGHLTTVQWLWSNRTEGCTTVAVDFAIYNGHFPVVKWFSELADFQPRRAKHTAENTSSDGGNACIKKQPSGQATLTFE
ncbi:Ankyrin repeat-containing domain [Phytophthora cactorum]|nr:Ankyrin repeat-containing domain [Phytophthora cactorum]